MEPKFKRVVFLDEWIDIGDYGHIGTPYPFQNYVLGWLLEPTERELDLIKANAMFGRPALILREDDGAVSFAHALGPELIPEVDQSPENLLIIEARLRRAASEWTRFFETMDDP